MAKCECCGQEMPDKKEKLAEGVDKAAWEQWLDYRKKIKKPLKQVSYKLAQKKLAAYGDNQLAVVEQSMSNGWQGLFELRDGNGQSKQTSSSRAKRVSDKLKQIAEQDIRENGFTEELG